jgi:pyruvate carboxylase
LLNKKGVAFVGKGLLNIKADFRSSCAKIGFYTEGSLFQVINLLGQQVLVGKTTQQLDVSALPQGTYVLKVGTEVAKFVKQ